MNGFKKYGIFGYDRGNYVQYVVVNSKGDLSIKYSRNRRSYNWYYAKTSYDLNRLSIDYKKSLSAYIYNRMYFDKVRVDDFSNIKYIDGIVEDWMDEKGIYLPAKES